MTGRFLLHFYSPVKWCIPCFFVYFLFVASRHLNALRVDSCASNRITPGMRHVNGTNVLHVYHVASRPARRAL